MLRAIKIRLYPNKTHAFPKLGCNNGKLDWIDSVKSLMIKYLEHLPIIVEIYE